ncbi:class I SAM-dependent methyltransferase [Gracilibacillus alcaliphilus]|uniref:class I SAM-dependent methyltransferase n=1 Tax=Gracilibacillus alcaliphilus TaxID=1401441 RepID=UPI00195D6A2D|nr:class I SAM-dependent methyltransferase [Gracilibacillus alcaliphilus]MBM7676050.1 SAM-dependent methyltransferase [Gracilibacillus alcaliphilus]
MSYTKINEQLWDRWSQEGDQWTRPISSEEFQQAQQGNWHVLLTPTIPVPKEWFGSLHGKRVLGLASGGGQQGPIFCALGADVTIMDQSAAQLATEKAVAEREGYDIELVKADMTQRFPFDNDSFDLIFHPVSNTYVEELASIWEECYRVLRQGGRLLTGFTNPEIYMFNEVEKLEDIRLVHPLPYNPLKDFTDAEREAIIKEEGLQFSHTMETQIRGQLQAGFLLKDFYEDYANADEYILSHYFPQFYASLAVKL